MGLNYKLVGEGPPLLLVHGLGVTFPIWQELAPLLSPHYKLILVELPGNGASSSAPAGQPYYQAGAAALEDLRQTLNIEQWHILGYSLGAWVVQAYLNRWPVRVQRVVFLCPALLHLHWWLALRLVASIDPHLPTLTTWMLSNWRLRRLVLLLGFDGRPHPYATVWQQEIESQPVDTIKKGLRDLPGMGRAPFSLPEKPVLFIWGDSDAVTTRQHTPRSMHRVVAGNHSAPMLSAGAVTELILEFIGTAHPRGK